MGETRFGPSVLAIDAPAEACRIARAVETQVLARLRRRGLVVGVSGGVDSAVSSRSRRWRSAGRACSRCSCPSETLRPSRWRSGD